MPPVDKSKAAGISASSFLDLKAELSKQQDDFSKKRLAGQSRSIVGGVKRPDKKPTVWARQNNGVKARAARDIELEAISKPTLESARAALERKSKVYDQLRRGKTGGLNDNQYNSLLVDFDAPGTSEFFQQDSDDDDESRHVPQMPTREEADPIVEYEDEFGRLRTARRSEVPRDLLRNENEDEEQYDPDVIYNPGQHFPVYEHSAEKQAQIIEAYAEENNPLAAHYDASREVRAKGAGFYQFSADEETRKAQMEELKASRDETNRARHETGAVDVLPGEVEGLQDTSAQGTSSRSRAMEKRKREIEERRQLLLAKRRKTRGEEPVAEEPAPSRHPAAPSNPAIQPTPHAVPPARYTGISRPGPEPPTFSPASTADPFALLESKGQSTTAGAATDDAERFLAQLGRDLRSGMH